MGERAGAGVEVGDCKEGTNRNLYRKERSVKGTGKMLGFRIGQGQLVLTSSSLLLTFLAEKAG